MVYTVHWVCYVVAYEVYADRFYASVCYVCHLLSLLPVPVPYVQ